MTLTTDGRMVILIPSNKNQGRGVMLESPTGRHRGQNVTTWIPRFLLFYLACIFVLGRARVRFLFCQSMKARNNPTPKTNTMGNNRR